MNPDRRAESNITYQLSEASKQAIAEYPISRGFVDRIIEGRFSPRYPFPAAYQALTNYRRKYAVAQALITDGRYPDIRFLVDRFLPPQTEMDPLVTKLRDDLAQAVREELIRKGDPQEIRKARHSLTEFAQDVADNRTLAAQEYRQLVGLFGASYAVDILYICRPEYRGVPVEDVSGALAKFLGNFLVVKGEFHPGNIEVGLPYLDIPDFQTALVEVIKGGCLTNYNQQRKTDKETSTAKLFQSYTDNLTSQFESFHHLGLNSALDQVRAYHTSLFSPRARPANMVEFLKTGRAFPDLPQLINIKEIEDKRRVGIGDEMGMGKSLAPILFKEEHGLGTAIIVAPKNVIPTWQKYLSDQVSANGERAGYFKPGQAPRVLVIDDQRDLVLLDQNRYDYILISQEKMTNGYVERLEQLDHDMLVVDEVHKIKNLKDGVRAANLVRLSRQTEGEGKYCVVMSGTLAPNKVFDIAIILKLLYPERFAEISNKELVARIIHGDLGNLRSLIVPRVQMKRLTESVAMPRLQEDTVYVELSQKEKDAYEILLGEDEIPVSQKLTALRQFLLNPRLLEFFPEVESAKIQRVGEDLRGVFAQKRKAVMFVNDYVEGVIRGEEDIIARLGLPEDVVVRIIHGNIPDAERIAFQQELNQSDQKMLLVVSGLTADVGVDFSGAEDVSFYNEPWTLYGKRQQLHRVFRPGLKGDLECRTYITAGTIEEGIHLYIKAKYQLIEKLLRGIPLTDLERDFIERDEELEDPDLEVNPELARYYFSVWDMMLKIFGHTREIGEEKFKAFLDEYGMDYAKCYQELGSRSYQANAGRVTGTIIAHLIEQVGQDPAQVRIIDVASGPEILRQYSPASIQPSVVSMDINPHHFRSVAENKVVVGSFTTLPFAKGAADYVNLSLAWHYTNFVPSKGEYERLTVPVQINHALKVGGIAVINMIFNCHFKDEAKFRVAMEQMGFEIAEEYSGEIVVGNTYQSKVFALRKVRDIEDGVETLAEQIGKVTLDGLKLPRRRVSLKDSRKIVREFNLNGRSFTVQFNDRDLEIAQEEETTVTEGNFLKGVYGSVGKIPTEELFRHGFSRFWNGKRYVLFKKLSKGTGGVVIR